jgi:hypothetical protein
MKKFKTREFNGLEVSFNLFFLLKFIYIFKLIFLLRVLLKIILVFFQIKKYFLK